MHDGFESERFNKRPIEDLKERYYSVSNRLTKVSSFWVFGYVTMCEYV